MCTCSCSWSASFSVTAVATQAGSIIILPIHEEEPSAPQPKTFSSREPLLTAPPVASAPQVRDLSMRLCSPGARSKAGDERAFRVNAEGFACPNYQCPYFGLTDASTHALVDDGKHGRAERIQTFRGPACQSWVDYTTITAEVLEL